MLAAELGTYAIDMGQGFCVQAVMASLVGLDRRFVVTVPMGAGRIVNVAAIIVAAMMAAIVP